jgi:hypothetical protein
MTSDTALKVKELVWEEILNDFKEKVPVVRGMEDVAGSIELA